MNSYVPSSLKINLGHLLAWIATNDDSEANVFIPFHQTLWGGRGLGRHLGNDAEGHSQHLGHCLKWGQAILYKWASSVLSSNRSPRQMASRSLSQIWLHASLLSPNASLVEEEEKEVAEKNLSYNGFVHWGNWGNVSMDSGRNRANSFCLFKLDVYSPVRASPASTRLDCTQSARLPSFRRKNVQKAPSLLMKQRRGPYESDHANVAHATSEIVSWRQMLPQCVRPELTGYIHTYMHTHGHLSTVKSTFTVSGT